MQSYSDYLDFESRSREKPSFRINERSFFFKFYYANTGMYLQGISRIGYQNVLTKDDNLVAKFGHRSLRHILVHT